MTIVTEQSDVSELTRQVIWQDLWDAERYVRYYGSLAGRYRWLHRIMRGLLLASVLIEATLVLPLSNPIATGVGVIVIVSLVVWEAISDYAKNAALLGSISADCVSLNRKWDELWLDIESYTITEGEARSRRRELHSEFDSVERRIEMSPDNKLAASSAEEAKKVVEKKYAQRGNTEG